MSGGEGYADVTIEGQPARPGESGVRLVLASPHYFETEGMRIVVGRDISAQDTADSLPVVVVNQAFARHFVSNLKPIGRRFALGSAFKPPGPEIAGVVEDARYSSPAGSPEPTVFLPVEQMAQFFMVSAEEIEVRAAGDPSGVTNAVRRAIQEVDSNLPITGVTTLSSQVQDSFGRQRTISGVTASFGILGASPGQRGPLRSHGLQCGAKNERNRYPHGSRRQPLGCTHAGRRARHALDHYRSGSGNCWGTRFDTFLVELAVCRQAC